MEEWQDPKTIALWIGIAVLFFLMLLGFIFLILRAFFGKVVKTKLAKAATELKYQQDILDSTIQTQEMERKRIAADLHDALIGKLTVVNLQQEKYAVNNKESIKLVNECIAITRRISHDLSPPLLEFSSLTDLLREVIDPWQEKIKVQYLFDIRVDTEWDSKFKIQFVRIVQEIVTNIDKHANATKIFVHYRQTNRFLGFYIKDNGKGFDKTEMKKGLGQKNIESRVLFLNGSYKIRSKTGKGTSTIFIFNQKTTTDHG